MQNPNGNFLRQNIACWNSLLALSNTKEWDLASSVICSVEK